MESDMQNTRDETNSSHQSQYLASNFQTSNERLSEAEVNDILSQQTPGCKLEPLHSFGEIATEWKDTSCRAIDTSDQKHCKEVIPDISFESRPQEPLSQLGLSRNTGNYEDNLDEPSDVPEHELRSSQENAQTIELKDQHFKDQESQLSDSLPAACAESNRNPENDQHGRNSMMLVNTSSKGHRISAACSTQTKGVPVQTGKEIDDLPPPPSYFECIGMGLAEPPPNHQSKPRALPRPPVLVSPSGRRDFNVEGGDTAVWHKPQTQKSLWSQRDVQCEVLLLQERQDRARSQNNDMDIDSTSDHQLLAFLSCVMFWPIGLLAIYYANTAHSMKTEGFVQQSSYYSKRALALSLTGIAIGTVMYFLFYMRHRVHL